MSVVALPLADDAFTTSFEPFFMASIKRPLLGGVLDPGVRAFGDQAERGLADFRLGFGAVLHGKAHDDRNFVLHIFGRPGRNEDIGRVAFHRGRFAALGLRQRIAGLRFALGLRRRPIRRRFPVAWPCPARLWRAWRRPSWRRPCPSWNGWLFPWRDHPAWSRACRRRPMRRRREEGAGVEGRRLS